MTSGSDTDILQNPFRCDICGKFIDMSSGDDLVMCEYGIEDDEVKDEYDLTDQDAMDAVADALEEVGESGADYELAKVIREKGLVRAHGSCLDETNYSILESGCESLD